MCSFCPLILDLFRASDCGIRVFRDGNQPYRRSNHEPIFRIRCFGAADTEWLRNAYPAALLS